ncbi:MAG: HAD family hydrolase [Gammaproteobacteria bacterium]|nr:HAD family hydrolase [Gammaproteobacteria bacterium]
MPLRDCHHWIFDMDGTLTVPVHDFNDIRRQIDIPADTPILETIARMEPEAAEQASRRLHQIEMDLAAQARPQPDALEVLEYLTARGGTLGILTRNDEEIAEATLRASGLDHLFPADHVVGRMTCAPKPSPDGVRHLLEVWRVLPAKTVMVGDFLYDIEAGKRAGVRTVHFDSNGIFPWPEFSDHHVTSLRQILSLVG